jgi:hypothetical protein
MCLSSPAERSAGNLDPGDGFMIKKLAALGIVSALAFAPVLANAEDAAPAAKTTAPAKTHKHKSHKSHKSASKKPAPKASETPKS